MNFVINQSLREDIMKTVIFVLVTLFAGSAFSVDLKGKVGLQMEREQGAWFRYGTNIWLGATEWAACKALNKTVDANAKGVEFKNMQSGLTQQNDWTEHQAVADLEPLHTISCYIPDQDLVDDDRWSTERCWVPSLAYGAPDRILTAGDMEAYAVATYGDIEHYQAHHVPSPTDAGTYVTAAQFHGETGEFIYGTCAPAIFNIVRDEDGLGRSGETIAGYQTHKYCPPGTRLMYEYGRPDSQWGGWYCGEGRRYTGTLEYKQIPELLYDNCKHVGSGLEGVDLISPFRPECSGDDCPNLNMYLYLDYTGNIPGKEGLPDGWSDLVLPVIGKYNENLGKKRWIAHIDKETLNTNDGVINESQSEGKFTFMWMRGNGRMFPEQPKNGTIGNCGSLNLF
jgi:hypothetical protein